MKIISIGPAHPLRGGIADFNEQLARTLSLQGETVSIISFSLQYPKLLFPGKTQFSNSETPNDIQIETILNSLNPFNWIKVAKYIQKQNPDLVIINYWMPFFAPALGIIAKRIKKNTNAQIIAICHNLIPHEQKPGDTILTKYFVKNCDAFVGMSKSVINDIQSISHNKPHVYSPHPLYDTFGEKVSKEIACKYLNLNESEKYVLFFGLIRKYKGLDLLLEAFANEQIKKLGIKLIIAGEFYDKPEIYQEIIKKYSLENSVIIHNKFIPHNDVRYYFSAADIVAQTYHSATQSGITQIAYHFNKPMLVTNVGGLSEIVPHKKVGYVTEKNPTEIALALVDFFENNKAEEFSIAAEKEKEKYSWKTFTEKILLLFLQQK